MKNYYSKYFLNLISSITEEIDYKKIEKLTFEILKIKDLLIKEITKNKGKLLVLNGDVPLIKTKTLKKLIDLYDSKNADVSLITTKKINPHGYGRVFLNGDFIERIVEEKDCDNQERLNLLINAGVYCFNWGNLSEIIYTLQSNNNQKEIYLTDTISLLKNSSSL